MEELPTFVDDLFLFGYLSKDETVQTGNSRDFRKGKDEASSIVVNLIQSRTKDIFRKYCPQKIVACMDIHAEGEICRTIQMIEERNGGRIRKAWKKYKGTDKEPAAVFRYKIGTSEIPISVVLENLEKLENTLLERGFGFYSIDYTRDFSGTLEYSKLVDHLRSLDFEYAPPNTKIWNLENNEKYILDVSHFSGNNILKYTKRIPNGDVVKTKLYNKIVCNFEAGEVSKSYGSHLFEYVQCPNKHLEKTFEHPDVLARGVTRLEVSILGFDHKKDYSNVLENEF